MSVMKELEQMHINEVIRIAKDDKDIRNSIAYHYIIKKYKNVIKYKIKTKNYFMPGATYEDLLQEGMYGIYKSIKDFKEEAGEYEVFLRVCVERQLISAVKMSTRKKHEPLNRSLHLDKTLPENDNLTMMDLIASREEVQHLVAFEFLTPEEQVMLEEDLRLKKEKLYNAMSKKEREVYELYIQGKTYKEIKEALNVETSKLIDNAVQRFKRKMEVAKEEEKDYQWEESI